MDLRRFLLLLMIVEVNQFAAAFFPAAGALVGAAAAVSKAPTLERWRAASGSLSSLPIRHYEGTAAVVKGATLER